jgi:hypothetical protein
LVAVSNFTDMGRAKRRGTYEQRLAEALQRAKAEQAEQDRLDDLAYIERQKAIPSRPYRAQRTLPALLAIAAALSLNNHKH